MSRLVLTLWGATTAVACSDAVGPVDAVGSGPGVLEGQLVAALSVPQPGVRITMSGPASGEAESAADGSFAFVGLDSGTYELVASGYDSTAYHFDRLTQVEVGADTTSIVYVGHRWLRMGDSLPRSAPLRCDPGRCFGSDVFVVDAPPGETIDLGQFGWPHESGGVVYGASGDLLARLRWTTPGDIGLLTGWTVPDDAPVRLSVQFRGTIDYAVGVRRTRAALMKGRRPGPIEIAYQSSATHVQAPAGAAEAVDTMWIRNDGPEDAVWESEATSESVVLDPSAGVLPGGGGVAGVEIRVAAGAVQPDFALLLPDDPWRAQRLTPALSITEYDPAVEIVHRGLPFATAGVSATPEGDLVFVAGGDVVTWSPVSRTRSVVEAAVVEPEHELKRAVVAADGSLYVAGSGPDVVRRIGGTGVRTTLLELGAERTVHAMAVAPDGTVWAAVRFDYLYRIDPDGTVTQLVSGAITAVTYHEATDDVYFVDGLLKRLDRATGEITELGALEQSVERSSLAFDASGRLYVADRVAIAVYEGVLPDAGQTPGGPTLVRRILTPGDRAMELAVLGDWVYGVTSGCCGNLLDRGMIFRVPLG